MAVIEYAVMKIAMIGQKGYPARFGGVERHVQEFYTPKHHVLANPVAFSYKMILNRFQE